MVFKCKVDDYILSVIVTDDGTFKKYYVTWICGRVINSVENRILFKKTAEVLRRETRDGAIYRVV